MVLGNSYLDDSTHQMTYKRVPSITSVLGFCTRIIKAIDFVSSPGLKQAHQNQRVRISKSSAVLVGFFIFHSIPNALLLTKKGRRKYSTYGNYHSTSGTTKLIEMFLLAAALTHAVLGTKKAISRIRNPQEPHPHSRSGGMMLTGLFILVFMAMHLNDFRLNPNEDEIHLDAQVLETVDKRHARLKNTLYWLFVLSVAVHVWRGISPAWLYRLGFRGKGEITALYFLSRFLVVCGSGLYTIPLLMSNPYSQSSNSPVHGPRIISVD